MVGFPTPGFTPPHHTFYTLHGPHLVHACSTSTPLPHGVRTTHTVGYGLFPHMNVRSVSPNSLIDFIATFTTHIPSFYIGSTQDHTHTFISHHLPTTLYIIPTTLVLLWITRILFPHTVPHYSLCSTHHVHTLVGVPAPHHTTTGLRSPPLLPPTR